MSKSKLQEMRKERGLKQRQLAAMLGKTQQYVAHAERTGIKTARLARIYARALNCNPLEIIEL